MSSIVDRPRPRTCAAVRTVTGPTIRELSLCWSFTWGDLSATVVPATIFATAAWSHAHLPVADLPSVLARCVLYFWLYIYTFNLSNQLTGIAEDRVNKPHRPLISGLITPRQAWWRLSITTTAFLTVGTAFGVLEWTLLWTAAWIIHNHLGGAKTWWGKNSAMVAGTIAQLAAAWQIVTPLTPVAWTWILAIAVPLGILVSLQDLRDMGGDIANGRRTAVMVWGVSNSRLLFCIAFAVYPVGLYFLLYQHAPASAVVIGGVACTLSWAIAVRVVRWRTPHSDNITYMLYTYWYCATLVSAVPGVTQ